MKNERMNDQSRLEFIIGTPSTGARMQSHPTELFFERVQSSEIQKRENRFFEKIQSI
jgi:hypothetical protein